MNEVALITISDEIALTLEKTSRKRRSWINLQRLIRQNEGKVARAARAWLAWTAKQVRPGLSKMRGKNPTRMVDNLTDWDEINAYGKELLKPIIFEIMAEGGKAVMDRQIIKQERFDPIGVAAVKWADKHTAKQVVEITKKTMEAIRQRIKTGLNAGESVNAIAMNLRNLVGLNTQQIIANANYEEWLIQNRPEYTAAQIRSSTDVHARRQHRRRAMTIGRTETAYALDEGTLQGYEQMGVKNVQWVADPDCCDLCDERDGNVYSLDEASGMMPAHPNCLPGDSLVLACGNITAVSKRWFEGEIIILETASGRKLSSTPHHPTLTDIGFCPANSLDIGSKVVSHGVSQGERFVDWYNINKPSTIQEIASSFIKSENVIIKRMPISSMDFHGDGMGGEIAIVASNRFLVNGLNPTQKKHFLKLNLMMRKIRRIFFNCLGMFTFGEPSHLPSLGGFMRRFNLTFALIRRHFFPHKFYAFRLASDLNITLNQSPTDSSPAHIEPFRNFFFRRTKIVEIANPINRKIVLYEFPKSIPFPWFFDKIIHKETSKYKGYVYNLETSESYYIANGIASHNCECVWVAA